MSNFDPKASGYVEVAERIAEWFKGHPDGRIETAIWELTDQRVTIRAQVWRDSSPETPPAGIGHSWLTIPGSTPYTRGSELENAETSAVGRALVMAGIPSKTVPSADEVAAKQANGASPTSDEPEPVGPWEGSGAIAIRPTAAADGMLRRTKDGGAVLGFRFDIGNGKSIAQVQALDGLAEDIADAIAGDPTRLHGVEAHISGDMFYVPWKKGGKPMRPYQRLILHRIVIEREDGFTLPVAIPVADGQELMDLL